jgi:hypothetical protein
MRWVSQRQGRTNGEKQTRCGGTRREDSSRCRGEIIFFLFILARSFMILSGWGFQLFQFAISLLFFSSTQVAQPAQPRSGQSLLERHLKQQTQVKGKPGTDKDGAEEEEEATHPWTPFNRETDLNISRNLDRKGLQQVAKKAQELNSRFSRGS